MMKEEVVVEVLHHILSQISDNTLGDCCEIIEKLFKSAQCNDTLSISKTLCSVKLLVKLYEKIYLSSSRTEQIFPAEKIFQGIKYLSNKTFDKCEQNDLLSVISVLCKIKINCEIPNLTELLTAYHNHVFSEILAISKHKEFHSEQVMLLMKILCTLYRSEFCEEDVRTTLLKQAEVEPLLFAHLALHDDESIATQTSLFFVPEFINFFRTSAPIKYIWTEFSKRNPRNHSRMFLVLCNFVSINLLTDEMNLMEFLVERVNYWELIQYGLRNGDITMRKQAQYLLKKTIDVLSKKREMGQTGGTLIGNANCHWDFSRRDELIKIYSDIIIILEYLNEEQVHIVRPIFEKIEKVVERNVLCDLINFSWILLIYEIMLMHESAEVIKWGMKSLLKAPGKVFLHEAEVVKMAVVLSSNLNNINLYYNNGLAVTEALGAFFKNVAKLTTGELFFKTFIKEICKRVWSPEALFFVTRSFSELRELSFWGPEEIVEIRVFVSKAFRTHNKTIRIGIRCEILNAVIALTHKSSLPLDSVILLCSKILTSKMFQDGHKIWNNVITYLKNGYSQEDAERVLDLFLNSADHNEECAALSIALFHSAFEDDFASKTFLSLLSSFKNSHQRPYCDVSTLNGYLVTITYLIEKFIQSRDHLKLFVLVFPFLEDLVLYIHSQIRVISSLKDFGTCKLYLKAFESLVKLINVMKPEHDLENLFKQLLESLEADFSGNQQLSSVQAYFGMKLVKVIYESCPYHLESVSLARYLLENLNKILIKEESAEDMHTVWGKMNSEFFEAKWVVLENLIRNVKIHPTEERIEGTNSIYNKDFLKMCIEGLDIGGYGTLRPVMRILARILPLINDIAQLEGIVDSVWRVILERRKTEDFKFCLEGFVKMLFHETLVSRRDVLQVLIKYIDLIFSDSSLVMVHTLIVHAENLKLSDNSMPVLCRILGKGLLFGPVQKKDDNLTAQVCSYVQMFWNYQESENITSSKIRARAAVKLLSIRHKKGVSKSVMDVLMQVESEVSKNRTRYFGNSFIHRIKTRLMQGVLLLLDSSEKEEKEKIAQWVYLSLMNQSPQTSVRNLQEWSLALVYKYYYSSLDFFRDSVKKTPKGWCSLMTVAYLLAEASVCGIDEVIQEILPFCMDQHFEARLYAEVVITKLYGLAQRLELKEILEKWRVVHDCIEKSIHKAEGNAAKNYAKLEKHFFFNGFNIRTHYSLQTIYYDLPRLTNVASDEWIPPGVFAGISAPGGYDLGLNLFNRDDLLQQLSNAEWLVGKSEECTAGDEPAEEVLKNYQKKMIPMKPLMPGWDSDVTESFEKDGLIVVASLIDRSPNLGGLARTCEVFGASELILNTTKCMEDKDFKSVSVTAEKWIRVKEVKAEVLKEYIIEMKEKGFLVVGAEQAVHSESLTKTKFPKSCLLILGNEKKGIPPNLIPLLDVCVEIPQTGIIRSLNVHVTGALFLWEYAKQNVFTSSET